MKTLTNFEKISALQRNALLPIFKIVFLYFLCNKATYQVWYNIFLTFLVLGSSPFSVGPCDASLAQNYNLFN